MDIWRWVMECETELANTGNTRLARLIRDLPSAVVDEQHAQVDAMVQEALPLARSSDHPWLEVFVRHWELQSRVLHREEVRQCLPLAVELIDLVSRPEYKDCPQAVCAVQDLAACYATLDGPGYVPQRLAVAEETLARIDARWPCFTCIGSELVDALVEGGRPTEALERIAQLRAALLEHDRADGCPALIRPKADALLALGRAAEALAELELWDEPASGASGEMAIRLRKVRALALLGRLEQATQLMPAAQAVSATSSQYTDWISAKLALIAAGAATNDAAFARQLREIRKRHETNGARFHAAQAGVIGAETALARGQRFGARLELDQVERLLPELRAPGALLPRINTLRAAVAELGTPGSEAEALAELMAPGASSSPEAVWERVAPYAATTSDPRMFAVLVETLDALGYLREAEQACDRRLEQLSSAPAAQRLDAELRLAGLLSQRGETEAALSRLAALGPLEGAAEWERARAEVECLQRAGDEARLRQHLSELVLRPGVPAGARLLLARLDLRLGDYEAALAEATRAAAELPPGEADWLRIELGTRLGRFGVVRESAARLGMPVEPGEDAIDEDWGLIQVVYPTDTEEERRYVALRTGPVTARVLELSGPAADVECGDDLVLFDATPLEAPPEPHVHGPHCDHGSEQEHQHHAHQHEHQAHEHEPHVHGPDCDEACDRASHVDEIHSPNDGRDSHVHGPGCAQDHAHEHDESDSELWIPVFRVLSVLQSGGLRSFAIDGLHPGEAAVRELSARLEALGGRLEVRSPDEYEVRVPALLPDSLATSAQAGRAVPGEGAWPGLYGFLAVSEQADLSHLHQLLLAFAREHQPLMVWPELCELVGDEAAHDLQLELHDCLGL